MTALPAGLAAPCEGCGSGVSSLPFTMAFQPIIDVGTREIYAYEALVRGPSGEGAASVLSRVDDENKYRFDQDCRIRAIRLAGRLGLSATGARLSINFLPNAVYDPEACIRATLGAARRAAVPLDRLVFEVSETERVVSTPHLARIFSTYQSLGFKVALDDFGAGHSGLSLLRSLRPDIIKLDMALIRDIDSCSAARAIVEGLAAICGKLGIEVVAEGVETPGESATLAELGVLRQQGYWFARPAFENLPRLSAIDAIAQIERGR
jgi:EAL domain-containing protein (putative c-di-GMP-specific phosphodiesterase class I)